MSDQSAGVPDAPHDPGRLPAHAATTSDDARYRVLFESAGDAIFLMHGDRFVDCNRRAPEMFGGTREYILASTPDSLSPPTQPDGRGSRAAALEHIGAAIAGRPQRFEWVHRRTDGTDFLAEVSLVAIALPEGPHVQAIVRDLTERVRAERERHESESRMRELVDRAPFGAHLYESQADGRLVFMGANAAADRVLGVDHRAFLGLTIEEAFPPLAEGPIPDAYREVARTGGHFDTRQVAYHEGEIRGVYEVHAFQTGPSRMAAFFVDVTERARAELALQASEAKYRLLAENVADVIWTMGLDLRLTYVSPSISKMHGGSAEHWIGRGLPEILTPESLDSVMELFGREMAEHGGPGGDPDRVVTFEVEQRRLDGGRFWTEVTARLVRDTDGAPISVIGVTRDISERREAEAERRRLQEQLMQSQRLESVGRLAGGVAHDFNNMLTPILGHTELLRNELPPEDPRHARLQEVLTAAERCRDLVRRLLMFARKQTVTLRPLDLGEVVRGFERMLRHTLHEDIRIEVALAADLPAVAADRGQIEQILMNLAVNAQDAMPDGGTLWISTGVTAAAAPGERDRVWLEVRDDGNGMSPATRERAFEPFFTTKEAGHGTGLGLAIVFGIVEQHGGSIMLTSAPGAGTTFQLSFPTTVGRSAEDPGVTLTVPVTAMRGTVLVVEDEPLVRAFAVEALAHSGFRVLGAADAAEALAAARAHDDAIDLLLTDVVLPDSNGRALHASLVTERPGLPVLYMSGYSADVIGRRGVLDPGIEFIQKPFSVRALAARVSEVLARR